MKFNVSFPQVNEMSDPGAVREFAQMVDESGFDHLTVSDHVLGANPASRPGWTGRYTVDDPFREPMVMLGFIAACTSHVRLGTSIMILPQRQTALVAKQMAEIDILSNGRAMLGVGVGWNELEFVGLNEDFHNRGRRVEEQLAVMRALWTERTTTFKGEFHTIDDAGLNTMPIQRPIPIWMGSGDGEGPMRRVARLADGWLPPSLTLDQAEPVLERFRGYIREAGRAESDIALAARIRLNVGTPDDWAAQYHAWQKLGATHFAINTNNASATRVDEHIEPMRRFLEAIGR